MPRKTKIQIWKSSNDYIILIGKRITIRLFKSDISVTTSDNTENYQSILGNSLNWTLIAEN